MCVCVCARPAQCVHAHHGVCVRARARAFVCVCAVHRQDVHKMNPPGGLFFDFIDVALSGRATISIGNGAGTWISPTSRPGARSRARNRLCIGWRSATVAQIVPDEDEYC